MDRDRSGRRQEGFTVLEAAISLTVLAVALLSLWGTLIYCSRSDVAAEQKNHAMNAAQAKIEELKSEPFSSLIAVYGPTGTVGNTFDVPGFDEAGEGNGRIVFFTDETAAGSMGLPLDLNGDGDDADTDVSADYRLLPVLVQVRWVGPLGPQQVELRSILRKEE